jgi:hypothetical protein
MTNHVTSGYITCSAKSTGERGGLGVAPADIVNVVAYMYCEGRGRRSVSFCPDSVSFSGSAMTTRRADGVLGGHS